MEETQEPEETKVPARVLSEDEVAVLVQEHMGWAESIARSVARAWNLDWQLDGLDGGAYEALLFCARRFNPDFGVPFKAYARKRIHEASSEEARKSKAWQKGVGSDTPAEQEAREISFQLFEIYPELREGLIPIDENKSAEEQIRSTIRQMLASASLVAAFKDGSTNNPETLLEYKRLFEGLATLEPVHQSILWGIYWGGQSMRSLAEEWGIDELTVIREHKEILVFVEQRLSNPKAKIAKKLKIRPSLRAVSLQMRKKKDVPPFQRFSLSILFMALQGAHTISGVLW